MNKLKLLAAVALTGLVGLSASAIPVNFSSINIKLTVMVQTNDTTTSTVDKFNVLKIKITNKDVLQQVANEYTNVFGTNSIVPPGAQLVLNGNGFWGGTFSVLGKTNNVLLANASSGLSDSYQLFTDWGNYVYTGQSVSGGTEVFNVTTTGELFWRDSTGVNFLGIQGMTTTKDVFPHTGNSPETFNINGTSDGHLNGRDAVVTGSANGSGKDTADF